MKVLINIRPIENRPTYQSKEAWHVLIKHVNWQTMSKKSKQKLQGLYDRRGRIDPKFPS